MKTKHRFLLFFVLIVCAGFMLMGALPAEDGGTVTEEDFSKPPQYLKSATYFSDQWPINFWSTESPNMDQELKQITEDGFNSIILVVPWREFQPNLNREYDFTDYALKKLHKIMDAAEKNGLWVCLRVGYTWDYYDDEESPLYRYRDLLKDKTTQTAWFAYAEKLYKEVSPYRNFYGGFLTWEDFWNYTDTAMNIGGRGAAMTEAEQYGFTEYVKSQYTLPQLEELYGEEFTSFDEIYIPNRKSPAARLFFEYYDLFLNRLLKETQKVFPDISMEVRLDQEPIYDEAGDYTYFSHESTYGCGDSPYVSAMTSAAMGQQNKGERISAESAVSALTSYLGEVRGHMDGKKMYIEQFLYMDNTPDFSHNAQVEEEQVGEYITGMAPAFREHTMGYGLWVYRNYTNNQLYNPQFALGNKGWDMDKNVKVVTREETPMASLPAGTSIRQKLRGEMKGQKCQEVTVAFRGMSEKPVKVDVTLGNQVQSITVEKDQRYQLVFPDVQTYYVTIKTDGDLLIDDVDVYSKVQDARLYGIDGQELDCIDAVRELNESLN